MSISDMQDIQYATPKGIVTDRLKPLVSKKALSAYYPNPSLKKVPTTESSSEWVSTMTSQGHSKDPQ